MKRLETLNADFYPRGVRFRKLPSGGTHLDDYNVPQLTKAELVQLWERSGSFLHRGSAKTLIAEHGKVLNVNSPKRGCFQNEMIVVNLSHAFVVE
jgi:hypothetical protein